MRVSTSRKVVLVHFFATIFMNACPRRYFTGARKRRWMSDFSARIAHTDATRMRRTLNFWRKWKCLTTTKRSPWFRRRVSACIEIHFLFHGNARWNAPAETRIWKAGYTVGYFRVIVGSLKLIIGYSHVNMLVISSVLLVAALGHLRFWRVPYLLDTHG